MNPTDPIDDSEILLRHIPAGDPWQATGPKITSANFRLRAGESGISVSRANLTTPEQLLQRLGRDPASGSRVALINVREVRALGIAVVPVPLSDDSGHAEIRSDRESLDRKSIQRQLARLCHFMP